MPPSGIQSKSPKSLVQKSMNESVGEDRWVGQNPRWRLLLKARNQFVDHQLTAVCQINPQEFKALTKVQKIWYHARLEAAFYYAFFDYTRDGGWMQDAVGEKDYWIKLQGAAAWHVKWALAALEKASNELVPSPAAVPVASSSETQSTVFASSQDESAPFDAVYDSVRENNNQSNRR